MRRIISLDFDGVVHRFSSAWTHELEIHDGPTVGAFEFIRTAMDSGWDIHILSARVDRAEVERAVLAWFLQHGLELKYVNRLVVTSIKRGAHVYIDDRGIRFDGTWPALSYLENLKTWSGL